MCHFGVTVLSCCVLIHVGSNDEVALSQALNTLHGIVLVRSFLEI